MSNEVPDVEEEIELVMRDAEYTDAIRNHRDPLQLRMSVEIRDALRTKYINCETSARDLARELMPWFIDRLKETPNFENMFKMEEINGTEVPLGVTDKLYSIHFAATAPVDLQDANLGGPGVISGFEALIAVGLHLNPKFGWVLQRAKSTSAPVPLSDLPRVSLGDARHSAGLGVYALQKGLKAIVGQTVGLGFRGRLGDKAYSKALRVVGHLGTTDQRKHRTDFILWNVLPEPRAVRAWLAQALETLGIVFFGTTRDACGMNSRIADDTFTNAGIGPQMYLEIWTAALQVCVEHPMPRRSYVPGMENNAVTWARTHICPTLSESVSAHTVVLTVRNIYPLAATKLYDAFPPMPSNATIHLPPRLRGQKVQYLKQVRETMARGGERQEAPNTVEIFNHGVLGAVLERLISVTPDALDELEGTRQTRTRGEYTTKRIMAAYDPDDYE